MTRHVEQLLREHQLSVTDVWNGKALEMKERFIHDVQDIEAKRQIQAMEQLLAEKYSELASYLEEQHLTLDKILVKNQENHAKQFDYLQQKN
ncbi:bacillithiol biosynthesis BshC [Lysinibacillus sp. MHQ-1]|nr:bacillithiol biosynthesis BshC [Lysinibacillus sp. MHQ-1]